MKKLKNNNLYHTPVLLKEAIDALQIRKGFRYIDATLGGGGHTELILEKGGYVLAIDRDEDAIQTVRKKLNNKKELTLFKGNFRDIREIAEKSGFVDCDGILLDLGTSVHQLRDSLRGFSFKSHDKLDMRMDKNQDFSALEIINKWSKDELIDIFERYGEESEAVEVAEQIVKERKSSEIIYADDLSEIILKAKKRKEAGIHPATQVFQAIRIAVNDELNALKDALRLGIEILGSGGRIVIISFHSLEDRVVKQAFKDFEKKGKGKIITKKPISASAAEIKINKKARSAKLRVFEKK